MNQKINFYLPDFYYKKDLNLELILIMKEHPEYFYDNINIGAVYGCFPGSIWNGGRLVPGTTVNDQIYSTISAFNSLDVPVRFTYTNCLLEDKHLNDTYCNYILDVADNGFNEIIVNSPILENYLREKYPDFKYILSTTKCERNVDKINKACDNYDLVVIDYRDNKKEEFLLNLNQKDKIEILINAYCYPNCPNRETHYKIISQNTLDFAKKISLGCGIMNNSFFQSLTYTSTVLTNTELYNKYINMGFQHFKIEGRSARDLDVIESYVYYLVKPEYKDLVRYQLIRKCWR